MISVESTSICVSKFVYILKNENNVFCCILVTVLKKELPQNRTLMIVIRGLLRGAILLWLLRQTSYMPVHT